ncbi:MAG: hypothetical protein R3F59_01100 [Myxococcota bacterium]
MRRLADTLVALWMAGCSTPGMDERKLDTATADTSTTDDSTTADTAVRSTDPASLSRHPLVATVIVASWTAETAADSAWITWEVDGEPRSTPPRPLAEGPQSEVLLGTPPQTAIAPVLHVVTNSVEQTAPLGQITTGSLPPDLVPPTLLGRDPARQRAEPWLLTTVDAGPVAFFGPFYTVILDPAGRIVWYRLTEDFRMSWQATVRDGRIAVDASTVYRGEQPEIVQVPLDLSEVEHIPLTDFAQAWGVAADGAILYNESADPYAFWLTRRDDDGTTTRLWDCNAWMSAWRDDYWACASNVVRDQPARGTMLYSMFVSNTIVEVDPVAGAPVRVFGEHPDAYQTVPPEAALHHPHGASITAEGTLLLQTDDAYGGQWAREYAIDDTARTLTQILAIPSQHYAAYAGQVRRLPSGNLLWEHGTAGVIEELDRMGEPVWGLDWSGHLLGDVTPIADLYALVPPPP